MSDDHKSTFAEKAATAAAIGAGVVAAAAIIPQDELMKKGLPGFWESIKGIAQLNWLRLEEAAKKFRPTAFAWGAKLWSVIKWWTLASILLVVGGIHVKTSYGSNVGHVLVAAGTVSFAGLGLLLFVLSDGIASILFFKIKVAGGILKKATDFVGIELPEPTSDELKERKAKLQKYHDKVKLVLAANVVLTFSLLFTMFFPAWSTLGWTLIFWAMVAVALCAAIYLDLQMGKAVTVVFYVTLAMIAATFVIFLLDRLTGGALGFGGFQKWLLKINASELLVVFLVLVPVTLLLVGVFTKDKETKVSYVFAAKYVGIGCGLLAAFLLYKGTISWKQLSGKETDEDAVGKTVDIAKQKYMGVLNDWETETKPNAATPPSGPQGTTSHGGSYLPPPTGNAAEASPPHAPSEPVRVKPQRRASKPLPKEEPKQYTNLTQGMDDLEALGY